MSQQVKQKQFTVLTWAAQK